MSNITIKNTSSRSLSFDLGSRQLIIESNEVRVISQADWREYLTRYGFTHYLTEVVLHEDVASLPAAIKDCYVEDAPVEEEKKKSKK